MVHLLLKLIHLCVTWAFFFFSYLVKPAMCTQHRWEAVSSSALLRMCVTLMKCLGDVFFCFFCPVDSLRLAKQSPYFIIQSRLLISNFRSKEMLNLFLEKLFAFLKSWSVSSIFWRKKNLLSVIKTLQVPRKPKTQMKFLSFHLFWMLFLDNKSWLNRN